MLFPRKSLSRSVLLLFMSRRGVCYRLSRCFSVPGGALSRSLPGGASWKCSRLLQAQ